MRRREFIRVLGGAAIACPFAAHAQQAMPVIGFISPVSPNATPFQTAAFHKGLGETGHVEGKNVTIEYRWGENRVERMPALAADLVRRRVNVIAAFTTVAGRAVKAATGTIPIVFLTGDDPIASGLVTSLSRPSANLTGATFSSAALGAKRLELLRALIPNSDLIGVLTDPNSPESITQSRDVTSVARTLAQPVLALDAGTDRDIEAAFANMAQRRVGAFFASGSPFFNARRDLFAALAARHALPGMYPNRNFTAAGGLVSYGASIIDTYRQAGIYAGRILKGAKPADLPILQPTKFELVINVRTAKALGLAVPDRLLALADDVIE
jgi:putative ABC transport system substrate-binding protein